MASQNTKKMVGVPLSVSVKMPVPMAKFSGITTSTSSGNSNPMRKIKSTSMNKSGGSNC